MSHMKTATVRELRNEFPKLAASLGKGEEILLTRRSNPIAKIVPIRELELPKVVDWSKSAAAKLKRRKEPIPWEAVEKVLEENLGRY